MKTTALLVLKCAGTGNSSSSSSPGQIVLANTSGVSPFNFFHRAATKEFIVFIGRHRNPVPAHRKSTPLQSSPCSHEQWCCCHTCEDGVQLDVSLKMKYSKFNSNFIPHVYGSLSITSSWDISKASPMPQESSSMRELSFVILPNHEILMKPKYGGGSCVVEGRTGCSPEGRWRGMQPLHYLGLRRYFCSGSSSKQTSPRHLISPLAGGLTKRISSLPECVGFRMSIWMHRLICYPGYRKEVRLASLIPQTAPDNEEICLSKMEAEGMLFGACEHSREIDILCFTHYQN